MTPRAILAIAFDEEDYIGEIPNKVKLLTSQFASFFQGEIT